MSLLVIDSRDPYRWVAVDGTAELSLEGATEQIDRLAKKYLGATRTPTCPERRGSPSGSGPSASSRTGSG